MRAIAEFIMRGRTQAILAALVTAALPMMFWISAAAVGLVTLRKGATSGVGLLMWAVLPALAWFVQGDPTPLFVITGTFVMAVVLRQTVSWPKTLMSGLAVGALISIALETLLPDVVAEILSVSEQLMSQMAGQVEPASVPDKEWLQQMLLGGLAAVHLAAVLGSLVLARWWQAHLYNPGGFRQEFHQLRLPPVFSGIVLALVILAGGIASDLVRWIPLTTLPFVLAGLALVHGALAKRELGGSWLAVFYALTFVVGPYMYTLLIMLAFSDSFLDIRKRIPAKS